MDITNHLVLYNGTWNYMDTICNTIFSITIYNIFIFARGAHSPIALVSSLLVLRIENLNLALTSDLLLEDTKRR